MNCHLGIVAKLDHMRHHAPSQIELVAHLFVIRERKNTRLGRTQPRRIFRHVSVPRENQHALSPSIHLRHHHCRANDFLALLGQLHVLGIIRPAAALDTLRNAIGRFETFQRIFPDGRLTLKA